MKIKTYLGLKELDKVFENIPDEVRIKIKEESSIDDVLKLLGRYEKPIKVVQRYKQIRNIKANTRIICEFVIYKAKNKWNINDIERLNNIKLPLYYLKEEFLNNSRGYHREPSERRDKWIE